MTEIDPSSMMLQLPLQLLASANKMVVPTEWPSVGYTVFFIVGCIVFLLLNAFFVASEFAIVKVRPSQIEQIKKKLPKRSKKAEKVVNNLDGYLSANQLGITIASLALGLLAEPYIAHVLEFLLLVKVKEWTAGQIDLTPYTKAIGVLSYFTALAFFTVLHVVIGELIPKAIAIRKPLETTLRFAGPLDFFYRVFYYLIKFLNGIANFFLRKVFNIDPVSEGEHVHSSQELAYLVAESGEQSVVTETEKEIMVNALELNDICVKDVMTTRGDVIVLDVEEPFSKAMETASQTKHTRFPLVVGHLDNAIGLVHIKDIFKIINEEKPDLKKIKRPLKVVPESMPLDTLLKFFQKEKEHLALVVDEFGDNAGLVFMDNVIEELVGEIQDEFDNEDTEEWFKQISDDEFIVEGALTLNELTDYVPELELERLDVTTVSGLITQILGKIPEVGETAEIDGYEAIVTSAEAKRVGQVSFKRLEPQEEMEIDEAIESAKKESEEKSGSL